MKYFDAIWRYKLETLYVQFWFHSILNKNCEHKEICWSALKYHRAYYLHITLLISLETRIKNLLILLVSQMMPQVALTVSSREKESAQFPLRKAFIIVTLPAENS